MSAEAGKRPDSEGPWTKAGVIITAAFSLLGLIVAYLGLAASSHWAPFSHAGPDISATSSTRSQATSGPSVTAAPASRTAFPSTSESLPSPILGGAGGASASSKIGFCAYGRNTCLYYPYSLYYTAKMPDATILVYITKYTWNTFETSLLGWNLATSTNKGTYTVGANNEQQVSDISLGAPIADQYGNRYTCLSFKVNASGDTVYVKLQIGTWSEVPSNCM
jgi:hypothetical protein